MRVFPEALRQVVAADVLLITKCDRASSLALGALQDSLRELNPSAPQHTVRDGQIGTEVLRTRGVYDGVYDGVYAGGSDQGADTWTGRRTDAASGAPHEAAERLPRMAQWLGAEALRLAELQPGFVAGDAADARGTGDSIDSSEPSKPSAPSDANAAPATHDAGRPLGDVLRGERERALQRAAAPHAPGVSSFFVTFAQPVPWLGFAVAMGQVLADHGTQLLRVKGLVNVLGTPRPQVIQCVQGVAYPSISLPAWPQDGPFRDGCGRLVFITRHLTAEQGESIRAALSQWPTDNAALRISAGDLMLPTRCWLAQRLPSASPSAVAHDGWYVQARRFAAGGAGPAN
jgi:G3E family GTPase